LKILLTGSDGFTGRPFAQAARSAGHVIVALRSDLTNREMLQQEVLAAAPDAVVHLAAVSYVGHKDESAFYNVNVIGTMNLLDALAKLPQYPRLVLLASSANVYGNSKASPISEKQTPAPVNHYAMSKLAMEYMALNYSERLPIVITRPFNYTGPGQAVNFIIPKLVKHFASKEPIIEIGNIHVEREFNDVEMIINAYLLLLQYGEPGEVYNVCSGNAYTLEHVIESLKVITGHNISIRVNADFVRSGELHRLCGNPTKLQSLLAKHNHFLKNHELEETLYRMLTATECIQI
jgi:nucleoside-diphosphate-sugar epimerase